MARFVFGLMQSLDGYVDHMSLGPPPPALSQHFTEHMRGLTGGVYGARMYEIMRYWDDDQPGWDADDHAFAALWRSKPKWVVSRSLKTVGPNATLISDDVETALHRVKADHGGDFDIAGPKLAHSLGDLGLIDEYRLYFRPIVLGNGAPFFAGPRPPLRLAASDRIGKDAVRLTLVPA